MHANTCFNSCTPVDVGASMHIHLLEHECFTRKQACCSCVLILRSQLAFTSIYINQLCQPSVAMFWLGGICKVFWSPSTSHKKLQLHLPDLHIILLLSARLLENLKAWKRKHHDEIRLGRNDTSRIAMCNKAVSAASISALCIPDTFVLTPLVHEETYEQHFDRSFSGFHSTWHHRRADW